jgi:hypothetical protein
MVLGNRQVPQQNACRRDERQPMMVVRVVIKHAKITRLTETASSQLTRAAAYYRITRPAKVACAPHVLHKLHQAQLKPTDLATLWYQQLFVNTT